MMTALTANAATRSRAARSVASKRTEARIAASLRTTCSVWLAELSRLFQKPMLDNIRRCLGTDAVRALRLQLDPDPPQRKGSA